MPRRGLPSAVKMRHDQHYVEALAASAGVPLGRMVPIDQVDPNPDQPRQVMGDLSELMASISEKGILEPLIVRQRRGRFQIVAGERRYQAAVRLQLAEVPAVIRDVADDEMIEIALIENLQRKDISPFEEADALQSLVLGHGYKHEEIARKIGKSRTSVTESLALQAMPEEVRELCRLADITSKSLLLQVVRQGDAQKMVAFLEQLTRGGAPATREQARAVAARQSDRQKPGRPKAFVFKYVPPAKSFNLNLRFRKSEVEREEIISALTEIIEELKRAE
ncbi:MAG: ParB/RepB/Spo0J family partition protein [Gammaproteobacteria bacterium]|nr:ParB/RepB/Spo0J family partition protein [Gammaproteobacteria bacterium]